MATLSNVRDLPAVSHAGHADAAHARRVDTTLVRVLAMVLIANSHLEALYPRPWLAGDGLLGNSLFYVLSGFGLAASAATRGLPGFVPWYTKRLVRIYPSLWL